MFSNWFRSRRSSREYPEGPAWWKEYLRRVDQPVGSKTPLGAIPFVVVDLETTGLNPQKDQILSIGALYVKDWTIQSAGNLECFVHQDYTPVPSTVEIHGILPREKEGSLSEEEALQKLVAFIGGRVIVGHHIGFDLAMLDAALKPLVGQSLRNPYLDTAQLARRLEPPRAPRPAGYYGLDSLCGRFGIPLNDRHTAAGDAFLTAILLLKLLARLKDRGIRHFGALRRRPA